MSESGMLIRFIQLFIDIYNIFISPDYPLYEYFKSILVLVVIVVSIVGALLFSAVAINAMFSVFRSR